ncbi:MAG: FxsA family protein [Pseudomonadales bacterium]|nr:FxsA family protein [Pseudomonadales bacterium]
MFGFKSFFVVFSMISLAEVLLFIEIGDRIGLGWTVLSVLATATVGVSIMRHQGFLTLTRIQAQMSQGQIPAKEMMEGALVMVCGALLLTPGFLTDGIGFALLTPIIRSPIAAGILKRGLFQILGSGQAGFSSVASFQTSQPPGDGDMPFGSPSPKQEAGEIIDGEFERKDD